MPSLNETPNVPFNRTNRTVQNNRRTEYLSILAAFVLVASLMLPSSTFGAPTELGDVDWIRDFEAAKRLSSVQQKPMFVLFQEIPGCQTCVSFGEEVLSHPLLVEAIEDEFVPVAIYNNRGGADREVLDRFKEPAWNNPIVRFVDAKEADLIPRRSGVWRTADIAGRMAEALKASGRSVPAYLASLTQELAPEKIEKATLAMHCYWEGEACLGALPGLLSSRTGSLGGREVVELRFDATRVSYADLLQEAKKRGCADSVFAHGESQLAVATDVFGEDTQAARGYARDASAKNQKFHLKRHSGLSSLELTPYQALRANHEVWAKKRSTRILSPRQQAQLQ